MTHVRSGDARRSAGVIDWCADATPNGREGGGSCDSVPSPRGQPDWRPINRHTLSWNAAAAWWAYAYTQLSTLPGARVVGQDQLVAGPYPDNVPFVACLSWEPDGTRNAKYWVMHMLAHTLGSDERSIQPVTNHNDDAVFVGAEARHFPSLQRKCQAFGLGLAFAFSRSLDPKREP